MTALKEKLIEKIKNIPDEDVQEIYNFVASRSDALNMKNKHTNTKGLGTLFSGKWQDERSAEEIIDGIKRNRVSVEKNISL